MRKNIGNWRAYRWGIRRSFQIIEFMKLLEKIRDLVLFRVPDQAG